MVTESSRARRRTGAGWLALALTAGCGDTAGGCGRGDSAPSESEVRFRVLAGDPVETLGAELWPGSDAFHYEPPSAQRGDRFATLVRELVGVASQGRVLARVIQRSQACGFSVQGVDVGGARYLVLTEPAQARSGAGAYVFRLGPATAEREVVLQAPHVFFDRGSGEIALATFLGAGDRVRALFVNTAHRRAGAPTEGSISGPADACRNPTHALARATDGVLDGLDGVDIIQIHGFRADREIEGLRDVEAVVSAGDEGGSTPSSTAVATGIATRLGVVVARFPEDTSSLGATRNAQGASARARGNAAFVHVELGASLRSRLRGGAPGIDAFVVALLGEVPPKGGGP